jgi:hypothetical protein
MPGMERGSDDFFIVPLVMSIIRLPVSVKHKDPRIR